MNIYPYVYRLDHPVTGEFYIGYNSGKGQLGIDYFTSSKIVKPRFHEFHITEIVYFEDAQDAYDQEQQLIFENWDKLGRLNRAHYHGKRQFDTTGKPAYNKGKPHSEDTKKKISAAMKDKPRKPMTKETKQKISAANKGKLGKLHTDDAKRKMSEAGKGKPKPKVVCRVSDRKEMTASNFSMWLKHNPLLPVE